MQMKYKNTLRDETAEQERKYLKPGNGELIHLGKNNSKHIFDETQKLASSVENLVRKIDFGFFPSVHCI